MCNAIEKLGEGNLILVGGTTCRVPTQGLECVFS
jgi:hypothetical protein